MKSYIFFFRISPKKLGSPGRFRIVVVFVVFVVVVDDVDVDDSSLNRPIHIFYGDVANHLEIDLDLFHIALYHGSESLKN